MKDIIFPLAHMKTSTENIVLTPDHWLVINFLRDFYSQYHFHPAIRIVVKMLAEKLGPEKGNSIYLHQLFPESPIKQASKIAGLPEPKKCL